MKKLFVIMLLLLASVSFAGNQSGTITFLEVRAQDGLIHFALSGTAKENSPACATRGYWIIRDENSGTGKMQYAMLLLAQAAGKKVFVNGLNTCTRCGDGEDVNSIGFVE